jgi:hypothetical protein
VVRVAGSLASAAGIPLASALVAAVVALLVARRAARSARETWLLDERHAAYVSVVEAANNLLQGYDRKTREAAMDDPAKHRALLHSLHLLELVAPDAIRKESEKLRIALPPDWTREFSEKTLERRLARPDYYRRYTQAIEKLLLMLREDLVPKHMR